MSDKSNGRGSGAPRGNHNRTGKKSVERERLPLNLSLSTKNGLLDLAGRYLISQGVPDTDENIKQLASDWFYLQFAEWLKRGIETNDSAIIL